GVGGLAQVTVNVSSAGTLARFEPSHAVTSTVHVVPSGSRVLNVVDVCEPVPVLVSAWFSASARRTASHRDWVVDSGSWKDQWTVSRSELCDPLGVMMPTTGRLFSRVTCVVDQPDGSACAPQVRTCHSGGDPFVQVPAVMTCCDSGEVILPVVVHGSADRKSRYCSS